MDGYFARDSAIRRIAGESVLMLGGGRALLMQVAHPGVAAGVAAASAYGADPWRRLARTLQSLYTIVLGTQAEADRVGAVTQAVHAHVPGALDPQLQLWVHATLVDTGLVMYETYVRPLDEAAREEFYADMRLVAHIFGVPPGVVPATLHEFRAYQGAIDAELRVTDDARRVAAAISRPPVPAPFRSTVRALSLLSVGLLPSRLREDYEIPWTRGHAFALRAAARTIRFGLPATPRPLRATERLPLRLLAAVAR